ncbi:MAG TPA: hypothetical protein VJU60_07890 [Thermoleophilaceae bacterium]|nr:hypothetical protein [Thermoleophilaceae bacterium]
MPYLTCPHCGTRCFSVARHSTREVCPVCEADLKPGLSVTQRTDGKTRFCHACASMLEPGDEVVEVLGRPVHASCALYRRGQPV